MSTTFVWDRLYWADKDKGTEEPAGDDPIKIRPVPDDVADLKVAALPRLDPALLGEVKVYPPKSDPIKIRPVPDEVVDLEKKVKDDDLKEELQGIGITQINVYPPKSCASREKYPASKELSAVMAELRGTTPPTSSDHPLVVVAPAQNETNGENYVC